MNTLAAVDLVLALLTRAQAISALVAQAQAANRDLNDAEWAQIITDADASRAALVAAIEKAKSEGR
jgi:predicted phage tail protein